MIEDENSTGLRLRSSGGWLLTRTFQPDAARINRPYDHSMNTYRKLPTFEVIER